MKRLTASALLLLWMACSVKSGEGGIIGVQGPAGPAGAPGDPGTTGELGRGQSQYKDANGVSWGRGSSVYVDAEGFIWVTSTYGGTPSALFTSAFVYLEENCGGTPYLGAPDNALLSGGAWSTYMIEPRMPFWVPFETSLRVRPDDLRAERLTMASFSSHVDPCQNVPEGIEGMFFPLDGRTVPSHRLTPTQQHIQAPIHREAAQ